MKRFSLSYAVLVSLSALFFAACSDDDSSCDPDTFEPSCLSEKYLEICTHGEIARQEASTCHKCVGNEFVKDTSSDACK